MFTVEQGDRCVLSKIRVDWEIALSCQVDMMSFSDSEEQHVFIAPYKKD